MSPHNVMVFTGTHLKYICYDCFILDPICLDSWLGTLKIVSLDE